jgi:alpha-tubulin suppressor-like RCC1 family protein
MMMNKLTCIVIVMVLLTFAQPIQVMAAPKINDLAATGNGGCVVVGGYVWCWGSNSFGQLGDGTLIDRPNAVRVVNINNLPLSKVTAIAGNGVTYCAVINMQLWCWGKNMDGTYTYTKKAERVKNANGSFLSNVKDISIGTSHACATMMNGQLTCWGSNYYGQLGIGTSLSSARYPTLVKNTATSYLSNVQNTSLGYGHSCAVAGKKLFCWGDGTSGKLGMLELGSNPQLYATHVHAVLNSVTSVSVGEKHSCALNNLMVYCWGSHDYGQLGDPALPTILWVNYGYENGTASLIRVVQANLSPLTNAIALSSSMGGYSSSTCAIISKKSWCWGLNSYGQLGDGFSYNRAGAVLSRMPNMQPFSEITSVSTNHNGTCAVNANQLWCWGYYKNPARVKYISGAFIP